MVTKPMIMWSNIWFGTWSNTWPIHIIFKKQKNLILLLSNLSSLTHHPSSKTNINPTLIVSCRCHWLATLIARRGHHQLIDRRSKTFTNIAIVFIDAIYKEFYECWFSGTLIAKLYLKRMRAWLNLSLAYQLIAVSTPSRSDGWVRKALGHQRGCEWSGKRMASWTQSENLLLERQHQLLSIDFLSKIDPFQ